MLLAGFMLTCVQLVTAKPMLVVNLDNDSYFLGGADSPAYTEDGIRRYLDEIVAGGAMTHLVMCVSGQRVNFDSKTWEPIWEGVNDPGPDGITTNHPWCANLRRLHERGIDPYRIWIGRAREKGVSPWLSLRMNDHHNKAGVKSFYRNERRFYLRPDLKRDLSGEAAYGELFDYAKDEVRRHAFDLVREVLDRYDPDGLELDWMRSPGLLTPGRERELAGVLTEFMRDVRKIADAAGLRRNRRIRIAVRVPWSIDCALGYGMDVIRWVADGSVDAMAVCNFFLSQDFALDISGWVRAVHAVNPAVVVLPGCDMLPCASPNWTCTFQEVGADRALLDAWASIWSGRADGHYLFNALYLAEPARKAVLSGALTPVSLARNRRRYHVSFHESHAGDADVQLPGSLVIDKIYRMPVRLFGSEKEACICLGFDGVVSAPPAVNVNGVAGTCPLALDLANLYSHPKKDGRVFPRDVMAALQWCVPVSALRDGENAVEVHGLGKQETANVVWVEIGIN